MLDHGPRAPCPGLQDALAVQAKQPCPVLTGQSGGLPAPSFAPSRAVAGAGSRAAAAFPLPSRCFLLASLGCTSERCFCLWVENQPLQLEK